MSSFGAQVNPVGGVTADFGLGYPYYFTARADGRRARRQASASTSASSSRPSSTSPTWRCAGGCSSSRRARSRWPCAGEPGRRHRRQRPRHVLLRRRRRCASLAFSDIATVNGSMRYSLWTDKFCPTDDADGQRRRRRRRSAPSYGGATMALFGEADPNTRALHRPAGSTSASASRRPSTGSPRSSSSSSSCRSPDQLSYKPRLAFRDAYNGALIGKNDHFVYGMAGIDA